MGTSCYKYFVWNFAADWERRDKSVVCNTMFVNWHHICFFPFWWENDLRQTRFEDNIKRFRKRFITWFKHADTDHIIPTSYLFAAGFPWVRTYYARCICKWVICFRWELFDLLELFSKITSYLEESYLIDIFWALSLQSKMESSDTKILAELKLLN